MDKTTMGAMWHPLMDCPDMTPGCCVICGRSWRTEKHHIVPRSAGELYRDGVKVEKPVVELCGFGNNLRDADGRLMHHGMAHHKLLHFRWTGQLEFLITEEPCDYLTALGMEGWRRV